VALKAARGRVTTDRITSRVAERTASV
jgi:hypothetical protein